MAEITEDARRCAYLDALAYLSASLNQDDAGVAAVLRNCHGALTMASLGAMVLVNLELHGVDPAGWVASEQRQMLGT